MCSFFKDYWKFEDYWKNLALLPFARQQVIQKGLMENSLQKMHIENALRTVISPLIEELNRLLLTDFLVNNQKKCTLFLFQAECMRAIKISDADELIDLTKKIIQELPEHKNDLKILFKLWEQIKEPLLSYESKKLSMG